MSEEYCFGCWGGWGSQAPHSRIQRIPTDDLQLIGFQQITRKQQLERQREWVTILLYFEWKHTVLKYGIINEPKDSKLNLVDFKLTHCSRSHWEFKTSVDQPASNISKDAYRKIKVLEVKKKRYQWYKVLDLTLEPWSRRMRLQHLWSCVRSLIFRSHTPVDKHTYFRT